MPQSYRVSVTNYGVTELHATFPDEQAARTAATLLECFIRDFVPPASFVFKVTVGPYALLNGVEFTDAECSLLRACTGRKGSDMRIPAIKFVRDRAMCSLKDAKEFVDLHWPVAPGQDDPAHRWFTPVYPATATSTS